jgi:hypothetical protein
MSLNSRLTFTLLMGVSVVLRGVERLLAPSPRVAKSSATPARKVAEKRPSRPREHYFTIRQTRSEIGLVFWVLQGFGCYDSFTLLDTWREAMDEANRRLAMPPVSVAVPQSEYAGFSSTK